jgi:hypothetical protein
MRCAMAACASKIKNPEAYGRAIRKKTRRNAKYIRTISERIVTYVQAHHKIVSADNENCLIAELLQGRILCRSGFRPSSDMSPVQLIRSAIDHAVAQRKLGYHIDQYGVVIALLNEWPPTEPFTLMSAEDFEPLALEQLVIRIKKPHIMAELMHY